MGRIAVAVRGAHVDDVPALAELLDGVRDAWRDATRDVAVRAGRTSATASERLAACIDAPDYRVVVAECDGVVAGMAIFSIAQVGPLRAATAVQVNHLMVADRFRRRGVGHALVAASVAWAEEVGADEIVVGVPPTFREANRFYARLGFAPLVVRRIAPVAALRRRLVQLDRRPGADNVGRRLGLVQRPLAAPLRARVAHAAELRESSQPVADRA